METSNPIQFDQETNLQLVERPPRIQPPLPEQIIPIPHPPNIQERNRPILQLMLPLITVAGYLLMSLTGASRNILFMLPMSFAMVFSFYLSFRTYRDEEKRQQNLVMAYLKRLETMRLEMNRWHQMQRQYYEYNYLKLSVVLDLDNPTHKSHFGSRIWERRWGDADFAVLRLGVGDIPSRVIYELNDGGSDSSAEQNLWDVARQLAEDSRIVTNCPVLWHLRQIGDDEKTPRAQFTAGIYGKEVSKVRDFINALLVQYAAFHPPSEAALYVIGTDTAKDKWKWARALPHTNSDGTARKARTSKGDRMVFGDDTIQKKTVSGQTESILARTYFWDTLKKELEARRARMSAEEKNTNAPFLMIVVDMLPYTNAPIPDWLYDIPSMDVVNTILNEGDKLGVAIIFLTKEAQKIPSDCQTVIEIVATGQNTTFYYSQTGVNSPRFIGFTDKIPNVQISEDDFAKKMRDNYIRLGYGAELDASISLLDLYHVESLADIPILDNWRSNKPDWLRVTLGREGGGKDFSLYLQQDHDGVHGMIAGTTGSGKSELLLTLVAGLALRYPPDWLNLLLVDYKGGTAFDVFHKLPHAVDILTNLEGNVVERMFIALRAELERRQALLTEAKVSDIVKYNVKRQETELPPLPFLFIIIDEFAEMVKSNSDYKAYFDSITRLGRSLGISLLLATQRPTGAVTEQMSSNIKYRICLRVQTADDSRELLGQSDAVYLPSNIPGRAYVRSDNIVPKLVQMAYTGDAVSTEQKKPPIVLRNISQQPSQHNERDTDISSGRASAKEEPPIVIQEIVRLIDEVNIIGNYPRQYKPWPDPLPARLPINLPIDDYYIAKSKSATSRQANGELYLNAWFNDWLYPSTPHSESLLAWANGHIGNWENALCADIGLVDIPQKGKQRILTLDLNKGPMVVYGASGWGKTSFLHTLIVSLAITHTPNELHIYAIDCGRGGLSVLESLPHLGRPIDMSEEARVERLFRVLSNIIKVRKNTLANHNSFVAYNNQNRANLLPAILVVIDNYSEFKENYGKLQDQLTSMIRAGRAMGLYFVFTADQTNALTSAMKNLFTQRLTFKLADSTAYMDVVGRGATNLTETPGRGFISLPERDPKDRIPREFQVALPCVVMNHHRHAISSSDLAQILITKFNALSTQDQLGIINHLAVDDGAELNPDKLYLREFGAVFQQICQQIKRVWGERELPLSIDSLETILPLASLLTPQSKQVIIGKRDSDRQPLVLSFTPREPHLLIIGPPQSGRTTTLRTLIFALTSVYTPQEAALVLVDSEDKLAEYGGKESFANLPHVVMSVTNPAELSILLDRLKSEYDETTIARLEALNDPTVFSTDSPPTRHLFIIIDHYENSDAQMMKLAHYARLLYRKQNLHFVITASIEKQSDRNDTLIRELNNTRAWLILQATENLNISLGKVPAPIGDAEVPPGRGNIWRPSGYELVQIALPYNPIQYEDNEAIANELDAHIANLIQRYPTPAQWHFIGDLALINPPKAIPTPPKEEASSTSTPPTQPIPESDEGKPKKYDEAKNALLNYKADEKNE